MELLFLGTAVAGGTLLVGQFLLGVFGGDHDGHLDHGDGHFDAGHDAGDDGGEGAPFFFGMLSLRTIAAALTFFGLGGLASYYGGLQPGYCILIAVGSGALAMYLVAYVMRMLSRLRSDGSVRIENAVGTTGTVYLRIPGNRAGAGKVTLVVQGRTVECQAITGQDAIPTGARVRVVALAGPDTVEVTLAQSENTAHV
jgi:hypothetical protein